METPGSPPPLYQHGMAYDSARGLEREGWEGYAGSSMSLGVGPSAPLSVYGIGAEAGGAAILSLSISDEGGIQWDKPKALGWGASAEPGIGLPLPIEEGRGGFLMVANFKIDEGSRRLYNNASEMSQAIMNSGAILQAQLHQAICGMPPELSLQIQDKLGFEYWSILNKRDLGLRAPAAALPYLYEMLN